VFSRLVTASAMVQSNVFRWKHLREQVVEAVNKLSATKCVGYHGNLDLGGKIWEDVKSVRKVFPGRPHYPDRCTGRKAITILDEYFVDEDNWQPGLDRPVRPGLLDDSTCPTSIPQIVGIDDTVQPFDDIEDKEGWKQVYPELKLRANRKLLDDLSSKKKNTPLDLLHKAGLLDPYQGSLILRSKTKRNDMFFLDKVGTEAEIYELSILQALLLLYNLLTPQKNERGWWMIACGLTKGNGHPLHERVQTRSYSPEMRLILDALLFGYKVLECRFVKWVQHYTHCENFFTQQKKMVMQWDQAWENVGKELRVSIPQELVRECWLSMARGTTRHLDKSNYGHSIAFYIGFNYYNSPQPGFGIPELRFLWEHPSGSVMAIKGWQWIHMSLKFPEPVIKMMNACFVNEIK
jgi:hypothetical protein